jgi:ABC-type branched-subunit amino acid transport system substrate-binding protein
MRLSAVVALATCLLAGACGDRLSTAQRAALDAQPGAAFPAASASQAAAAAASGAGGTLSGALGPAQARRQHGPNAATAGTATGAPAGAPQGRASSSTAGSTSGGAAPLPAVAPIGGSAATAGPVCPAGEPSNSPGVTPSEIAVGNVSTLTGPIPGLFLGAQQGIEAFAAYINSNGGVCGRRLVVKAADDNLDPAQNATATQSLVGQVLAFVGSFSVDDEGGAPTIAANNVPDIGEALSNQRIALSQNFSPQPAPRGWDPDPYVYFKQRYGEDVITHMAVFIENNSTALAAGLAERDALEALGYRFVVEEDNIQPTQTDFSSEVAEMQAQHVQGLIFQATAEIYADMARDMEDAGFNVPFADWGAPAYDPAFIQGAGPAANGAVLEQNEVMYEGEDAATVPEVTTFNQWYRALYHQAPNLFAFYGWTSGMLFVEGLDRGGAPTRQALFAGLRSITTFSAGGMIAAGDPATKTPSTCYIIIDVSNGKFVRDPADPPSGFTCGSTPYFYDPNA